MSNGSRAARQLRSDTASLLAANELAFAQRFAQLKGMVKKTKQASSLNAHQLAWKKEAMQLAKQRKQIEMEFGTWVMTIGNSQSIDKSDTFLDDWRAIESTRHELHQSTQSMARELQVAIRRAKAMMKAAKLEKREVKAAAPVKSKSAAPQSKLVKKKSVGFATSDAVPFNSYDPQSTLNTSSSTSAELSSFLSSLADSIAIDSQQLAAEENNLVQQLLLMQSTLDRFEQPVIVDDENELQTDVSPKESRFIELASDDQMTEEIDSKQQHHKQSFSSSPSASASTDQQTFLTAAAATSSCSPRLTHPCRTFRTTQSSLSSTSIPSFDGTNFPPDPPAVDPSVLSLSDSDQSKIHVERIEFWSDRETEYHQLQRQADENLSHLRQQFQTDSDDLKRRVDESDRRTKWSDKEQTRFLTILQSYKSQGSKRSHLLDRLRIEFTVESQLGSLCLADRVDLASMQRAYRTQRTALINAAYQHRHAFVMLAIEDIHAFDRSRVDEIQHRRAMEEQLASQEVLHGNLEILRTEKAIRDQAKAVEDANQRQLERVELETKLAKDAAMREKQRRLLELYHAHVEAESRESEAAARRERARVADEARIALEESRPRIARRQELIAQKRVDEQRREAEARQAEIERQARLDEIRRIVAPNVERDPERAMQSTQASAAEVDPHHALFAVHGYDMSTLLKDKRFRIQLALWTAGVSHTPYAKSIVMSAQPAVAPRPDMQSSVFPSMRPMS